MTIEFIAIKAIENALISKESFFIFDYNISREAIEYLKTVDDFIPKENVTGEIEDLLTYVNLFSPVGTSVIDNTFVGFETNNCKDAIEAIITHLESNPYLGIDVNDIVRYKPSMELYEHIKKIYNGHKDLKFIYIDNEDEIIDGPCVITYNTKYPMQETNVYMKLT